MGKYAEKALELHAKGYNCAQAVACAFSDQVDMDEDQLFKVMEGFGAGMGGMHGTIAANKAFDRAECTEPAVRSPVRLQSWDL